MECDYKEVKNDNKISWKHFFRQLFVVSSIWIINFLCGLAFGLPTVMIPQMRQAANSTDAVSQEMASWLYSVFGYNALIWVVIICISIQLIGRKIPSIIVNVNMFGCFILLYFSTTLTHVLIAEIMQGVMQASVISLNIIVVLEFASPKYRGFFITIKSANFFWGVWVSNAIGTFYHWRYVPLFGILVSILNISTIFWPESPQWLASRGKYDKCRKDYRWLRGTDRQSEKELKDLIQSQIDYMNTGRNRWNCNLRDTVKAVCSKAFYKPMLLSLLLGVQYHITGKIVLVMYSIEIIKKITTSESAAYTGMLILDAVTILALYTGCILSKILNRRTLLLSCCFTGIIFLFVISLYLFLIELELVVENMIVFLVLLTLFSVFIGCGPMILLTPIAGELTPLRYKSSITMISSLVFLTITSTSLKLFPVICKTFHMSGTFLFYALGSLFCCIVLCVYLPETKDKTLQEIEDTLLGKRTTSQGKELLHTSQNVRKNSILLDEFPKTSIA